MTNMGGGIGVSNISRGKQFEEVIKQAFERVPDVSIDRLHDQMNGYAGSYNICDYIVYKYPHQYYIECKSVHGNTLPFSNVTDNQWYGLLKKSKIPGVIAGVMCWWIDRDVTLFIPIQVLDAMKILGAKSIRYDLNMDADIIDIPGKKKRVFFDYDMTKFFKEVENEI